MQHIAFCDASVNFHQVQCYYLIRYAAWNNYNCEFIIAEEAWTKNHVSGSIVDFAEEKAINLAMSFSPFPKLIVSDSKNAINRLQSRYRDIALKWAPRTEIGNRVAHFLTKHKAGAGYLAFNGCAPDDYSVGQWFDLIYS